MPRLAQLGAFSWAAASDGYGERSRAARLARHSAAVVATRMSQGDEETSDVRGALRRDLLCVLACVAGSESRGNVAVELRVSRVVFRRNLRIP